jgi:hypothetical protein
VNNLADAISDAAELFNCDGNIVWWRDGAFVRVDGHTLQEILAHYLVVPWLSTMGKSNTSRFNRAPLLKRGLDG